MNCPFCGSVRHRVVNTRRRGATNGDAILRLLDEDLDENIPAILRRRKCVRCGEAWGTAEITP
jgi:transcriptional regulator NrdR family protein